MKKQSIDLKNEAEIWRARRESNPIACLKSLENICQIGRLWVVGIIFILLIARPAFAWDDIDRYTATLGILAAADYSQSCYGFFDQRDDGRREMNPLLSEHPSRQELLWFGIGSISLLHFAARQMEPGNGKLLMMTAVAAESIMVLSNARKLHRYGEVAAAVPLVAVTWKF